MLPLALAALSAAAAGWSGAAVGTARTAIGASSRPPAAVRAIATPLPPRVDGGGAASDRQPLAAGTAASGGADADDSVAIMLLNLGGPDSLDAVEPFLYNLFADPEIITLPKPLSFLNKPLAWVIAKYRAPASREGYASIGGSSPLLATTRAQATALESALLERGVAAKAYVAMRYWHPFTDDAVADIIKAGHKRLVILPLYPQFSVSTSGSSLRVLEDQFYENPAFQRVNSIVVPAWYNRAGYVTAMARLIEAQLVASPFVDEAERTAAEGGSCDAQASVRAAASVPHVFFSAHGLPAKYVTELGDPYQAQTEATVALVMDRLKEWGYENEHSLAYQSRVGPVKWLEPYTDDVIPELAERGVKDLVVVPISFVSEHIETLEEIDVEYRELAESLGIERWSRVPALGLDARFIGALADEVKDALPRLQVPTVRAINDGAPVSLRVINDLVALSRKEAEAGPGAQRRRRYGFTETAERINGRIAMAAMSCVGIAGLPPLIEMVGTLIREGAQR